MEQLGTAALTRPACARRLSTDENAAFDSGNESGTTLAVWAVAMQLTAASTDSSLPRPAPRRSVATPGIAPNAAASVPARLPGEHFTAAIVFFVAGALSLVLVAEELAAGAFFAPRVLATVHLFTLGWLMLSIFGALSQFLPVAIGKMLRWTWLAHLTFALQVAGTLAFTSSLYLNDRTLLLVAGGALGSAFTLFAVNLAFTLASSNQRGVTWWALAGANVFLVVTPIYGIVLALNLSSGFLGADRFHFVARHSHVAIVGVVLLVVVGVAHKLLPMFLLSHGAKERAAWTAAALLFSSATLLSMPFGGVVTAAIAGVLAFAGVVAFVVQAAAYHRHARRKRLDAGMKLAAAGILGLCFSALLAPFALGAGLASVNLLAAYHVLLLGGLSLFVAGHYFKIVPFLVWNHRFGPLLGKQKVPNVADLYSSTAAHAVAALLIAGWLGLAVSVGLGLAWGVRGAALVFAAGALVETIVIARVAQRRPA